MLPTFGGHCDRPKTNARPMRLNGPAPDGEVRAKFALISGSLAVRQGGRKIVLIGIFTDGAVRRKLRRKKSHTLAHPGDPAPRYPAIVALVELRRDLLLEQPV